jgi:hypothetical protein
MPALFVWIWTRRDDAVAWQIRLPALVMVSVVLAQGTLYWHLELRSARDGAPLPPWLGGAFRALRALSATGLALAALEHVDYYHLQLEHDTAADWAYLRRHRRLRRAALAVDLDRSCACERELHASLGVSTPSIRLLRRPIPRTVVPSHARCDRVDERNHMASRESDEGIARAAWRPHVARPVVARPGDAFRVCHIVPPSVGRRAPLSACDASDLVDGRGRRHRHTPPIAACPATL